MVFRVILYAILFWSLYRYVRRVWVLKDNAQNGADGGFGADPYEVLGVSPGSDKESIRAAYRKKIAEFHPDRVNHLAKELQDLAQKRSQEINQAYNQLMKKFVVLMMMFCGGALLGFNADSVFAQKKQNSKTQSQINLGCEEGHVQHVSKGSYYCVAKDEKGIFSIKEGPWKRVNARNMVLEEGFYKQNLKSGLWKRYDAKGVLQLEVPYEYDQVHGVMVEYKQGLVFKKTVFEKGEQTGLYREYEQVKDPDSQELITRLKTEGGFLNQQRHGVWKHYREGWLELQEEYKDGVLHGVQTRWFDAKNKEFEVRFVDGKRHGTWTAWFQNGRRASEGRYDKDEKVGHWRYWNPDGSRIRQ